MITITRIFASGMDRPPCEARIKLLKGKSTTLHMRDSRKRRGLQVDQCGVRSYFLVDGHPRCQNHAGQAAVAAMVDRPAAARPDGVSDESLDARRWRALMRCGRIKMQGSAGVDPHTGERRNGSNVHFGAEFWPDGLSDEYRAKHPESAAKYDAGTKWGLACLVALVDQIIEQEAALAAAKGQP